MHYTRLVMPKFLGSSFLVVSSWHPQRHVRHERLLRSILENKLINWLLITSPRTRPTRATSISDAQTLTIRIVKKVLKVDSDKNGTIFMLYVFFLFFLFDFFGAYMSYLAFLLGYCHCSVHMILNKLKDAAIIPNIVTEYIIIIIIFYIRSWQAQPITKHKKIKFMINNIWALVK